MKPPIQLGRLNAPLSQAQLEKLEALGTAFAIQAVIKIEFTDILSNVEELKDRIKREITGEANAVLSDIRYQIVGSALPSSPVDADAGSVLLAVMANLEFSR